MTVYVVQHQQKRDPVTREFVAAHDFSSAEQWGQVKFLLEPDARYNRPIETIKALRSGLAAYDWRTDWILPTGNPLFIGWALALAADMDDLGRTACLMWSTREKRYYPIRSALFGDCEATQTQANIGSSELPNNGDDQ